MSANWNNLILSLKTVGGLMKSINEAKQQKIFADSKAAAPYGIFRETDLYFSMSFRSSNLVIALTQKRILALIHNTESICQPKLSKF